MPINLHKMIEDVRLFHQTFGHPIQPVPTIPSPERQVLRSKLIRDEYQGEFDPAWAEVAKLGKLAQEGKAIDPTLALAEFGDAIADCIYFFIGTALEYGIPLADIWDAVQTANMSKLWTGDEVDSFTLPTGWRYTAVKEPISSDRRCYIMYDETGKVRKPPSWKEPDIKAIIRKAMQ